MRAEGSYITLAEVEATVSSKGQVTIPKALRDNLGMHTGSRIRFSLTSHGGFQGELVRYDLADLWKRADQGPKAAGVMSFEEMDAAKARRAW
jgi:AbrB family looped-hinge helix DNA binding protein